MHEAIGILRQETERARLLAQGAEDYGPERNEQRLAVWALADAVCALALAIDQLTTIVEYTDRRGST